MLFGLHVYKSASLSFSEFFASSPSIFAGSDSNPSDIAASLEDAPSPVCCQKALAADVELELTIKQ